MSDKMSDMGALTIFEIFGFVLTPGDELFAVILSVAREGFRVEGKALLSCDQLLYRTGSTVQSNMRGVIMKQENSIRILLADNTQLIRERIEGMFVA